MENETIREKLTRLAPSLGLQALELLTTMYTSPKLMGTERECEIGHTKISMEQGAQLHQLIRTQGVRSSLEIGFAYGFSTVWMLDALPADGTHVAIDPFEKQDYGGVGLAQVTALAAPAQFTWIKDFSIHALSAAIKEKRLFDLIFIDGNHRFDDVLVDFYLADQALKVGGLMAFDDLWMPSIQTVVGFVETNRAYQLVPQPVDNMRLFRKLAEDNNENRAWDHFSAFEVHGSAAPAKSEPLRAGKNAIKNWLSR